MLSNNRPSGEIDTNCRLRTALHLAAFLNNYAITKTLLENGAKTNLVNSASESALHIAALNGSTEICNLLLQYGSNQFAQTIYGHNTVDLAITSSRSSSLEIMSLLLDRGTWNPDEYYFLYPAVYSPSKFSYLIYRGVDPYSKISNVCYNPIEIAIHNLEDTRTPGVLPLLLNLGIDFSRCQNICKTGFASWSLSSLKLALKCMRDNMINIEYNRGVWDRSCRTPLSNAGQRGRVDVLELFIQTGADLELIGDSYGTPLMSACVSGRFNSVKCLVRAGASLVSTRQGRHSSALDAAKHFEEIVHWLLVGRFTDQFKIDSHPHASSEQEVQCWTGVRKAEAIVDG